MMNIAAATSSRPTTSIVKPLAVRRSISPVRDIELEDMVLLR